MTLLIVEDEKPTINGILNGIDWDALSFNKVLTAMNVRQAKEVFSEQTVDIFLCDIEMPDGTGLDLLEWVRDNGINSMCIFLTCHEKFQYAREAIKLGSLEYLLKPVPYEELQKKLITYAERRRWQMEKDKYEDYGKEWLNIKIMPDVIDGSSATTLVEQVKRYIRDNLNQDLTTEMLAGHVHITQDYLYKIFKKIENMTLVKYITAERLFVASQLLRNPEASVSRVAVMAGYSNYGYFTKVFKKHYGMTPMQYRKQHAPQ